MQSLRPAHWVVVDDEDTSWPADVLRNHEVLTPPAQGLQDPAAEDRLLGVTRANFRKRRVRLGVIRSQFQEPRLRARLSADGGALVHSRPALARRNNSVVIKASHSRFVKPEQPLRTSGPRWPVPRRM